LLQETSSLLLVAFIQSLNLSLQRVLGKRLLEYQRLIIWLLLAVAEVVLLILVVVVLAVQELELHWQLPQEQHIR
jgi:hypothetical protein